MVSGPKLETAVMLAHGVLAALLAALAAGQAQLSAADTTAAFEAAGFRRDGDQWKSCGDPGDAGSYSGGAVDAVKDLNGDGRPEAVISEGSTYCFGNTGVGYAIVSQQANGSWKLMTSGPGIPSFLAAKGVAGWPDMEVGGPGFCFPVRRWNGQEYAINRFEYDGKPCRRPQP